MNIIHILHELKFSGAEIMYTDAGELLKKLTGGGNLTAVNTAEHFGEYAPYFVRAGYNVLHWPYPKGYVARWRYYSKVIDFLKREHYDVVHIHSSGMKWGMSYCAWRSGCRAIYTFHNVFRSHWYSYPLHWWLRWCAKNVFGCTFQTISDSVYENERKYYHNDTIKVYNWYGSNRFYPARDGEKSAVRKELGLVDDVPVIISVGGCSHVKRHTDVIKALPTVLKELPGLVYLHLGEGSSLDEEMRLAESLGVSEHVRFCGNQKDVRKFLVASDIYVMPSKYEGIPITTIEAMGTGIPAILYNVPGLRDFNKEEECSLLIPEDVGTLAKSIVSLYADKDKQRELTVRAKRVVDANFSMETNVRKIVQLYSRRT